MFLILWLASLVSGSDADRLASPHFPTREAAESRLRRLGPLAWPALWRAAVAPDAEARARADRLLAPWRRWCTWLRAAEAATDPRPPNAQVFWRDEVLRRRVVDIYLSQGLDEWPARIIRGDVAEFSVFFVPDPVAADDALCALEVCKGYLGIVPPRPSDR